MPSKIADIRLAGKGKLSYEWATSRMSIIDKIASKNRREKPLKGFSLGFCLHITKETSVLVMAAKSLGAEKISICSANPLSTQNDIAAFLSGEGINVFAWRGETAREYRDCIRQVLASSPGIVTDDGADLHAAAHQLQIKGILGGTEETTSGVKRLAAMQSQGKLMYPVIAVNSAKTKHLFDNRYGTGQSTIDGILRATGVLLSGKHVVVCGYGWVGKGVAARARGMGSIVTVTEVDPVKAMEAHMDGFGVARLSDIAQSGDIFITCTGQTGVIRQEHIEKMKSGAILANTGHFDVEIDTTFLYSVNDQPEEVRPGVERFNINGKHLYLLSKGRVVNLVAAEGHPPEVMALSFANQLLSIIYVAKNHDKIKVGLYDVPPEIDTVVSNYALDAMNLKIDSMTPKQRQYQESS